MFQTQTPNITIPGTSGYPISISGTIDATDVTVPLVASFQLPVSSTSLTLPITAFTGTDDVGVTGYKVTENATPPSAGEGGWNGSAPTSVVASGPGAITFWPWVKDVDGNVNPVY